jgi:hypothetical protein
LVDSRLAYRTKGMAAFASFRFSTAPAKQAIPAY